MGSLQNQLAKHKETAADVHDLRANVESLTNILHRKVRHARLEVILVNSKLLVLDSGLPLTYVNIYLHLQGKELESLTSKSAQQNAEIQKFQDVV